MTSLDDLVTPMTYEEAKATMYAILEHLGTPTTGWRSGAVVRVIVALVSAIAVAFSIIIVGIAKGILRETATGDWQTLHAQDTYGVTRRAETFGTGTVTLTNIAGGVYDPAPGDTIIQYTATGKTYRNVATYHLASGTPETPSTVTFDVIAIESGTASNADPNVPMTLVTTMSGVTVTANSAIVGVDKETDDELRAREGESLDALSPNGPAGAYLAMAKTATRSDGSNVGVTRAIVSAPSATGEVTVTVATATGAVSAVGSPSDLALVDGRIQGVTGPGCVPHGVTATTASAVAHPINVTADLYVYTTDGRTKAEIEAAAAAVVSAWMPTRPISGDSGGKVYQSAIRSKLMSVSAYCYDCTMTLPAADVTIAAGEVPTMGVPTITAHLVSP